MRFELAVIVLSQLFKKINYIVTIHNLSHCKLESLPSWKSRNTKNCQNYNFNNNVCNYFSTCLRNIEDNIWLHVYICIHPEGLLISMFTYAWGVCLHPIGNAWDTDWQQCLSALQDPLLLGYILGFSGKHLLSFVPLFSYNAVLPGWRGKTVSRREFGRNDLLWLTVTWSLAAWHCWQFQGKEVAFF